MKKTSILDLIVVWKILRWWNLGALGGKLEDEGRLAAKFLRLRRVAEGIMVEGLARKVGSLTLSLMEANGQSKGKFFRRRRLNFHFIPKTISLHEEEGS